MRATRILVVSERDAGQRMDVFLSQSGVAVSRSAAKALVDEGAVAIEGKRPKPSAKIRKGDRVRVVLAEPRNSTLIPEALPLDILYEDDDLIVVNKDAGMVVHPSRGQTHGTLVHALMAHCPEMASLGEERPGIVHRLDKGTSGGMVVAKNAQTLVDLGRQFKNREVKKHYVALVHGELSQAAGRIELPVGRHPVDRKRMAVVPGRGRDAVTEWARLRALRDFTLLKLATKTGRTHQIRVHLSHLKHPLVGDSVYGGKLGYHGSLLIERPALHALTLGFRHPRGGAWMEFEAPLADDIKRAVEEIESFESEVDKAKLFQYHHNDRRLNQSCHRP